MLDTLFNDEVTVRRLSGVRDGHGKPTLVTLCEKTNKGEPTDVPLFIDCFIERRRSMGRTGQGGTKSVDATLLYNVGESPVRLLDEDLVVVKSSGETFRVSSLDELVSAVEGSEYARVGLARTKAPVSANQATSEEA